jgi:hypothetical protein
MAVVDYAVHLAFERLRAVRCSSEIHISMVLSRGRACLKKSVDGALLADA